NFNLHHGSRSQPQTHNRHVTADTLLSTTSDTNLALITHVALTTFTGTQGTLTVDLAFILETLVPHILSHCVNNHADSGSNHLPGLSRSAAASAQAQIERTYSNMVHKNSHLLDLPHYYTSCNGIDNYTIYLQQFIHSLADAHVPFPKPFDPFRRQTRKSCTSWWALEIANLVKEEKAAHRVTLGNIADLTRRKNRLIQHKFCKEWRNAVHNAKDSEKGLWWLARWACKRSY
ncbi:peroxisome biogenesis factor 10, partial [Ascosphaera pollenicola]